MESSSADSTQPISEQLQEALSRVAQTAARNHRLAAAARAELDKYLSGDELQALTDENQDLETQIVQARAGLAGEQKAAEKWRERLSTAVEAWREEIDEPLSKNHENRRPK